MVNRPLFERWSREIEDQHREKLRVELSGCQSGVQRWQIIAERLFRQPVHIPGLPLAVRPFWRDWKTAPSLPESHEVKYSHH